MKTTASALLGLAFLAGIAVAGWLGLQWIGATLHQGGSTATFVNAILSAALVGLGYLYRSSREKRVHLEARLAEAKRALYESYVDILRDLVEAQKSGGELDSGKYTSSLRHFAFRSVLISSDAVVRAHIRFTSAQRILDNPAATVPAVGDVLLALRRDIGLPDTKLSARDTLGVFVNDIDSETIASAFALWEPTKKAWDEKLGWTETDLFGRQRA